MWAIFKVGKMEEGSGVMVIADVNLTHSPGFKLKLYTFI